MPLSIHKRLLIYKFIQKTQLCHENIDMTSLTTFQALQLRRETERLRDAAELNLKPVTVHEMIALAPLAFTASDEFLRMEAQRMHPKNSSIHLQPTYGWSA